LFNLLIVRSISLGVMLVALTGLLAGVTLLPATLGLLGHRIEWLRVIPRRAQTDAAQGGMWYRLSLAIMRRPWIWLAASVGVLAVLAFPVHELTLYGATADIMPPEVESTRSVRVMNDAFGANRLTPIQIVLTAPSRDGVWRPDFLNALKRVSDTAEADPRNEQVFSLATLASTAGVPADQFRSLTADAFKIAPAAEEVLPQFVNSNRANDTAVIIVFSKYDRFSKEQQAFIGYMRDTILPAVRQSGAVSRTYVGGDGAIFIDFRDATSRRIPFLVAGVTLVTFIMLLMFFQSVALPIKAILMNLASILATYGVLTMIFQYGWGEKWLGFSSLSGLGMFAPATLFAILFGLSTDYEVFMLSRVKEFYHQVHNNEEAVARGLQNTAGVITAAGLILVGTFGSFATANVIAIKEIGIGLAVGVLLDSTIVRVILVPASMRLMGNANWWMPSWLKRIVPELREGPAPELEPAPRVQAAGRFVAAHDSAAAFSLPALLVGHLRALSGSLGVEEIVLLRSRPLRIGRDDSSDLQFFDDRISRFHARVDFDPIAGTHVIVDLGSTNGVYVNGQRIAPQPAVALLREGDRLEFGGASEVVLLYELRPLVVEARAARSVQVGV
jgi:putative drug exporter of the RND superfamily